MLLLREARYNASRDKSHIKGPRRRAARTKKAARPKVAVIHRDTRSRSEMLGNTEIRVHLDLQGSAFKQNLEHRRALYGGESISRRINLDDTRLSRSPKQLSIYLSDQFVA
jgi:hypothetical protein